ncbi:MAG: DoxX family protein [Bacteroidetes bacterium]|nr:DoxX family protein [Bacteroidota bacterium]
MNTIEKIETWGDVHQTKWLALLRIILGLIIFFKGYFFLQNTDAISAMITNSSVSIYAVALTHIVALTHVMGGLLIVIGLVTRLACLLQVPILLGAIVFVNAERGFFSIHSELGLSILVLVLLVFFLVFGSGKVSVDEFMRTHEHT